MIVIYHSPLATWLQIPPELAPLLTSVLKSNGITYAAKRGEWYTKTHMDVARLHALLGSFAPVTEMKQPSAKERIERIKGTAVAPRSEQRDNVYTLPLTPTPKSCAVKFRATADALTKQIDAKLNSGTSKQNPTPKRARVIEGQRADAEKMQRVQCVLYALAEQWDGETIVAPWASITSKHQLEMIDCRYRNPLRDGYVYSGEADTWQSWGVTRENYAVFIAEYKAMAEGSITPQSAQQARIQELEKKIQFAKIDGFWSTPTPLAQRMVERAGVDDGMHVLEPSAGKGNIADAIRMLCPGAVLAVAERHYALAEILTTKGYDVVSDDCMALDGEYDRVILNPPFENGQDMAHVQHCYSLLNPGGRLVAIVGAGAIHNSSNKHKAFQEWLETVGASVEKLDESDYGKDHGRVTGVQTYLVVCDK